MSQPRAAATCSYDPTRPGELQRHKGLEMTEGLKNQGIHPRGAGKLRPGIRANRVRLTEFADSGTVDLDALGGIWGAFCMMRVELHGWRW